MPWGVCYRMLGVHGFHRSLFYERPPNQVWRDIGHPTLWDDIPVYTFVSPRVGPIASRNPMAIKWFYSRVNHSINHCAIDNIPGGQKKSLYNSISFKYFGKKVLLLKSVTDNTPSPRQFNFQDFRYWILFQQKYLLCRRSIQSWNLLSTYPWWNNGQPQLIKCCSMYFSNSFSYLLSRWTVT
jgi:hypothetical protein